MGKRSAKASKGFKSPERPRRFSGADQRRPQRGRFQSGSAPATDILLAALAKETQGATANQLAAAMGRQSDSREISVALKHLLDKGQVLEIRPGRYQVSGTGGEFSVILVKHDDGALYARFTDSSEKIVNPRYTLGAGADDVVQAMIGEDGQVLVTRMLRRSGREIVGLINFRPGGMVLLPDNRREGELPVIAHFAKFQDQYQTGNRVVGTVENDARGQAGVRLTRILGPESPEIEDFRHVCLLHDLPGDHPEEVEAEAKAFKDEFPLGTHREDLRDRLIFTIDPATAKDFDDAISLLRNPDGTWELGVHIADVSHYVREGTLIDAEAAIRGTSIYLINRVIPMLPEVLSNGLCSLKSDVDRYCLSAFLTLDKDCALTKTRVAQTLIRSRQRLTYEQALAVLENRDPGLPLDKELVSVLKQVSDIAQRLRKARETAGALNLFSVEHRFSLDVNGEPIEIAQETTDISHQLIEECMLLANRAVATWLIDQGLPCPFRIHEKPDEDRMAQFAHYLEVYGIDASAAQTRFGLQRLLDRLKKEPPAARLVLNYLCLRSFKKAVYAIDNVGHFALAFDNYCHFTSPIRRYPDLMVHRLVKRGLRIPGYENVEIRRGYMDAQARQSSNLEQRAESAERDLHARKSARYLHARMGDVFPGVVTTASSGGLSIQLMETGMEGFLPMRELGDDFYVFDPDRLALVGRSSGKVIGIGTEVDVQVVSVDIARADIVLGMSNNKPAGRTPQQRDQRRPDRAKASTSSKRFQRNTAPPIRSDKRIDKENARKTRREERRPKGPSNKQKRDDRDA